MKSVTGKDADMNDRWSCREFIARSALATAGLSVFVERLAAGDR